MIALPLITTAFLGSSLHNQADSTARIRGAATSSFNGQPIAGVVIAVPKVRKFFVTDATGVFRLDGLPPGPQKVRVSFEGRETGEYVFNLRDGQPTRIAVVLDVEAVDLDPVVVEARHPNIWRDLAGFYARMRAYQGFGHFITREEILRSRPRQISSLLAREGIFVRCVPGCLPMRFIRDVPCVVPVSVDGLPYREVDYDVIPIGSVAGVEVYRGTPPSGLSFDTESTTPSSVWQGGLYNSAGGCGSVMIWTR